MQNKVSIIIPMYNAEQYIEECLQSIFDQTYKNYEIIIVSDGSTDSSEKIVSDLVKKSNLINLKLLKQKNQGQGKARNYGLREASGEFVAFIDADDMIKPKFLEDLVNIITKDGSDIAICDWIYLNPKNELFYQNKNSFMGYPILTGKDTLKVLESRVYFTVNKIYRRKFLLENEIFYGEGYIYEDVEFYVDSIINSSKISIIHNPYYLVRVNPFSTTKTNYRTMKHYEDFVKSVKATIKKMQKNNVHNYYVYRYFIERTNVYANNRVPKKYRKGLVKEILEIVSSEVSNINFENIKIRKRDRILFEKVIPNKNEYLFLLIFDVSKFIRKRKKIMSIAKFIIKRKFSINEINRKIKMIYYKNQLKKPLLKDTTTFMGFNNNYTGNSKALFDSTVNYEGKFFFISNNKSNHNFVKPNTFKFYKLLARSQNIVLETWQPSWYVKRKGTTWVQLWHGSTIKKILFDSNEKEFVINNPRFKFEKFNSVKKWDFLISDSYYFKDMFVSGFLIDKKRIRAFGYPRVEYLHRNNDTEKIEKLKKQFGIPNDKKIVFYAPTWRDYSINIATTEDYFLEFDSLINDKKLKNYFFIFKNHPFKDKKNFDSKFKENILILDEKVETQDLILVSDLLITDYSSILFDHLSLGKPILLYTKDFEIYTEYRGLYNDVWDDLKSNACFSMEELIEKLRNEKTILNNINYLKEKYCNSNVIYSHKNILKLLNLVEKKITKI